MQIYLPIAEISVDVFTILALGGVTGVLSGMFGVGGGFLITPFLIFIGVPPAVAVATSANQIVAASVSGFIAHWRKQNVDFRMGWLLLIGGLAGSFAGVWVFKWLKGLGQIDLVISLLYVTFLSGIGILMAVESSRSLIHKKKSVQKSSAGKHNILQRLPLKMRFPRSRLYISSLLPLGVGWVAGLMVSIMGIGGGFLMIPAMIYLLRMPTSVVIGTSLFQIIFITANVTFLHAVTTHTVDILLALFLLTGSVIGAQFGSRLGTKLPADKLRGMLALLVLAVALKLAYGLFATPQDIFTVIVEDI